MTRRLATVCLSLVVFPFYLAALSVCWPAYAAYIQQVSAWVAYVAAFGQLPCGFVCR